MGLMDLFLKKRRKSAVELLPQVSKRAEDLTAKEQALSFVSIRRTEGALQGRDSRVIFGRRGTGKTHVLSYLASSVASRGEFSVFIDLRTIGSNNSIYSDRSIPSSSRATTLIRDLLSAIHDGLLDIYTDPGRSKKDRDLEGALEKLAVCIKTVLVTEEEVRTRKQARSEAAEVKASAKANFSLAEMPGTSFEAGATVAADDSSEWETRIVGQPRLSVNMGEANAALKAVLARFPGRVWLLLDEWSSLPEALQPYLADFIRRAVLPIQTMSVCIAAIEYRSTFRLDDNDGVRIGLELGSDISADINLDDYFIYDIDSETSVKFFKEMLYKHLNSFAGDDGLVESTPDEVIASVFSQDRVFAELVRAAEGVARDFINILQLANMRSSGNKITMNEVRAAAKDWFERDKQRNLDTKDGAHELLQWIRDKVIAGKKARAFLMNTTVAHPLIEFLFDERILHIARRSYSAKDDPGVRYRVWKVDYGCYVDLINTGNNPAELLGDGIAFTTSGELTVPDDDYRAVRRAILNIENFDSERT